MIRFELVVLLCLWNVSFYSQQVNHRIDVVENMSIHKILKAFENQYQFDFSYDVEVIKNIELKINQDSISIDSLIILLKEQTQFILEKVDNRSYILVENNETVAVCGFVIDSVTTFELTQANIIKNKNGIKLTDERGYFRLRLKPWDSISVSYLGYETKTIRASDFSTLSCDTIQLRPKVTNLSPVVINEYLTTGVQKNNDASINISIKKLGILPGLVEPDVLQSLQLLPGISTPTEDPAGLYIRGGTPYQNLVLWDGIKIYNNGHFFNQISTFNPYIVKNVKVYKGGTSVHYGDRVSGVIIIESDDNLTEKFKVGGGVNFTHADLFLKIPLSKKVGVMAASRRSTTDLYQNIRYNNLVRKVFQNTRADISDETEENSIEEESRDDSFSFSDTNFKLVWNPNENNTVKFSSIFTENKLNNTIPLDVATQSFSTTDIYKVRNVGASLNWEKKYTNNTIKKTNFHYSSYDTRYSIVRKGIDIDQNEIFNFIKNNNVLDLGAKYSLDIPIAKKQILAVGYQYDYNETKYEQFVSYTYSDNYQQEYDEDDVVDDAEDLSAKTNSHTAYTEYTYNGIKAFAQIGFRGSYLSKTDQFLVEPRIFSSVEVLKNFRVTASVELKNQQINSYSNLASIIQSIEGLPVADDSWILSGKIFSDDFEDFFPIVKSKQFTFGTLYTYKGWNFDLEGYYKKLTDISSGNDIILELSAGANDIDEIGWGSEQRIGFDFLIKKRIKNYRFWIGYSLSKMATTFKALQRKPFPSNFDQRHTFNISQTLKINHFEFALGWNFATGNPFTKLTPDENGVAGNKIDSKGINAHRLKQYHRLDTSIVYRFNFKTQHPWGGMLGFSLRNIYNRKNTINQGFVAVKDDDNDNIIKPFKKESLRLTPDVVIRFNF